MKVYEAIFKEGGTNVYALSVVENPAMEDEFIAFSEHPKKVELAQVNEEKRLLLGAALIPNKRIPRVDSNGNEFEMFLSEKTIENLAHSFMKDQNNNNSSLEHTLKLDGMSVVEAWTVQDPKTDKSSLYGKTYPKGTWVTLMKVDNDEMWGKVKNNEIKGFSIDALLGLQEIKLNTNINKETMSKEDFIDAFKAIFKSEKVEEVEKIEVVSETVEEVKEPSLDVNALKEALTETLAEFSKGVDEKLEALEVKLSKEVEVKEVEVEELKAELSKQPEVEGIVDSPEVKQTAGYKIGNSSNKSTESRIFAKLFSN